MNLPQGANSANEYRFRPRLIGGEHVYRLTPTALVWEGGTRSRLIPYRDILHVRLSYRPGNLISYRFLTEIWPREGGKFIVASVSALGTFNFENRGAAYSAFITELGRRIEAVRPDFRFETGLPAWRWWPAAAFGAGIMGAIVYLFAYAIMAAQIKLIVISVIFGALFMWQIGAMLYRNRRRTCDTKSIPADILPRES